MGSIDSMVWRGNASLNLGRKRRGVVVRKRGNVPTRNDWLHGKRRETGYGGSRKAPVTFGAREKRECAWGRRVVAGECTKGAMLGGGEKGGEGNGERLWDHEDSVGRETCGKGANETDSQNGCDDTHDHAQLGVSAPRAHPASMRTDDRHHTAVERRREGQKLRVRPMRMRRRVERLESDSWGQGCATDGACGGSVQEERRRR
jgi:hypothetical protein